MNLDKVVEEALAASIFAGVGLIVFGVAFWIMTKVAPFSVKKEIEEDQNTALAVIFAGVIIGVGLIIAAAIHS
jgi:putative membrane protein